MTPLLPTATTRSDNRTESVSSVLLAMLERRAGTCSDVLFSAYAKETNPTDIDSRNTFHQLSIRRSADPRLARIAVPGHTPLNFI